MTSERDRMLRGEFYNSRDAALLSTAQRARTTLGRFNRESLDTAARAALLRELLGEVGDGVWIEPPFFCDYGEQITIGADTFVNVNAVFLDSAPIRIGRGGLIGPGVQLLTAFHPARAAERVVPAAERRADVSPYRTQAAPIMIGDDVWIGGGALVMPGVTIGDRVTIGAGSVVTRDVPSDVLAFGNPCRVQREL
jgi:maltose O-acetyltransferase